MIHLLAVNDDMPRRNKSTRLLLQQPAPEVSVGCDDSADSDVLTWGCAAADVRKSGSRRPLTRTVTALELRA